MRGSCDRFAKNAEVSDKFRKYCYNFAIKILEVVMNALKILGFDIGISSIGWAYVEGGELKDCGVRIFTKAENPKDGSSLALPRREARGSRRRLARRKARLNELKRLITAEFGLNLKDFLAPAGELPKAYHTSKDSPYQLRFDALNRKLEPLEFARVILHIAKHRGYGNKHAKESSDEKNKKKKSEQDGIKGGIAKNKGYKENYETIGAYLYNEFYGKPRSPEQIQAKIEALKADYKKEKIKPEKWDKNKLEKQSPNQQNNVRNKLKNYERCLKQDWLKEELEIIFAKQREFGFAFKGEKYKIYDENRALKELDFESAVIETAFLQRPLKSFADKVGKCTFFADESRAPKDSLSAIEFVALTRIINTLANISKRSGEVYSAEQVREILKIVLDKGEITYKNLRKIIALDERMQFPKDSKLDYTKGEDAEKDKLIEFSKLKAFKKALGESFADFTRDKLDSIATDIVLIKSKDSLKQTLSAKYPQLNEAQREALSELNFDKFIDLSFKALGKILPFMRGENGECKRYDEAWRTAGLKEVAKQTQKGDKLPPLIKYEPNLANPVVARALSEYRKVLNALLAKYGAVHKIHLEFMREIGSTKEERKRKEKEQRENFATNEWAKKECVKIFGDSYSQNDLLKVKLWREQGEFCAYSYIPEKHSGKKIAIDDLKNPTMLQIDHIYPRSRSFDNSYMNKVLVFTSANQNKRSLTPYEFWGKDPSKKEQWDFIVSFARGLPKPKRDRMLNQNFKGRNAGFQSDSDEQDSECQIDIRLITSYIANLVRDYTRDCLNFLDFPPNVEANLINIAKERRHIEVISGNLTAMLRHYWGLHTIINKDDDKDRSNHLHHAIDAIILAYANAKHIKAYADFKRSREEHKKVEYAKYEEDFTYRKAKEQADFIKKSQDYKTNRILNEPCKDFRAKVKEKVLGEVSENGELSGGIFVSKPPRKRARGALHKETFSSIDDSDLLETYGGKGNPKEIQKQGVERAIKLGKIRQIGNKVADNGPMVRTDIFRHKSSGKFYGVPIYTMDYALGKLPNKAVVSGKDKVGVIKDWLEMDEKYEFCFSLFKDDLIKVQKKEMKGAELCYFKRFKTSGPSIEVVKHDNFVKNITPNQEQIFKLSKDRLSIEESMIAFQNLEIFEKWQVSPLGKRDFKANGDKPEIRQEIRLKSSPKDSRQKAKK